MFLPIRTKALVPFLRRAIPPAILLCFCAVAYLPLSSFAFSLKNDAFTFNFPNKYFFSEALRNGHLPVWNPFLNFGYPLYADPGFAWWQPVTWIFGLLGYNAYSFTIEVLTYIYLAGLGMYWLGRRIGFKKDTALAIGAIFMCSGFFVGNLQHINFLTSAAFLPWLFGGWLAFQRDPSKRNLFRCAVFAYLLCTGGHPAIPLASFFFFFTLTILYPFVMVPKIKVQVFALRQVKLMGAVLLMLTPLLLSYWQILPFYSRTGPVSQAASANTGFTLPSYLSFVFPFATIAKEAFFGTDVSMRNAYFTIPGILFFILSCSRKKSGLQILLLSSATLLLILSFGGIPKTLIYEHVPVLSWIRTNGEFRVFAIFGFLICGGFEFDKLLRGEPSTIRLTQKAVKILFWLSVAGLLATVIARRQHLFSWVLQGDSIREQIRQFFAQIRFSESLVIALAVCIVLCFAYMKSIISPKRFLFVLGADIIISCWMLLPVTGVGKTSVHHMQSILDKAPTGFQGPPGPVRLPLSGDEERLISDWRWYDKNIVHPRIDYPSTLNSTEAFFQSEDTAIILNKPAAFLAGGTGIIRMNSFQLSSFTFTAALKQRDTLVVLQNYFPGWSAVVNGEPTAILRHRRTFMAIPVPAGTSEIRLRFHAFDLCRNEITKASSH